MDKTQETKEAPARRKLLSVRTHLKAGGDLRRQELDHVGAYNFTVEISGVAAG